VIYDVFEMWGKHMAADLRTYIGQMRAAMDRGLPLTASDVLDGLEIALAERRRNDLPIAYDIGLDRIEDRLRRRPTIDRLQEEIQERLYDEARIFKP